MLWTAWVAMAEVEMGSKVSRSSGMQMTRSSRPSVLTVVEPPLVLPEVPPWLVVLVSPPQPASRDTLTAAARSRLSTRIFFICFFLLTKESIFCIHGRRRFRRMEYTSVGRPGPRGGEAARPRD